MSCSCLQTDRPMVGAEQMTYATFISRRQSKWVILAWCGTGFRCVGVRMFRYCCCFFIARAICWTFLNYVHFTSKHNTTQKTNIALHPGWRWSLRPVCPGRDSAMTPGYSVPIPGRAIYLPGQESCRIPFRRSRPPRVTPCFTDEWMSW